VWSQVNPADGGFDLQMLRYARPMVALGSSTHLLSGLAPNEVQQLSAVWDPASASYLLGYLKSNGEVDVAAVTTAGGVTVTPSIKSMGDRIDGREPVVAVAPDGGGLFCYSRFDVDGAANTTRTFLRPFLPLGVVTPDGGGPDGGGGQDAGADAGTDGGNTTSDGGTKLVINVPELKVLCTETLEAAFTANVDKVQWELVEGPGQLSREGVYSWKSVPPAKTYTVKVRALTPAGSEQGENLMVVSCPEEGQLTFSSPSCGCSAPAFAPLALLALLLLRRRRPEG
jgi:uncharacterized protein (TIGR03382 family)